MKKALSKVLALSLACTIFLLSGCGAKPAPPAETPSEGGEKAIKAAFLYDAPVGDGGWITGHERSRQALEGLEGVETTYIDSISESNGWKYMNDFAKQGYDVVFACSFGYMQDCAEVAKQNPDTTFMHCAGYMTEDNMGNYFGSDYQATYLAGIASGAVTKSNTIGYVVPFPTAQVLRNINAFAEGVKLSNPDAEVKLVWILTWYDPATEREAAETLIAAGADVVGAYLNSPSVLQTAEKNGIYGFGSQADQSEFAPKGHIVSTLWNWDVVYESVIDEVRAGTWTPDPIFWGMNEGLVDISDLGDMVPEETQKIIQDLRTRMKTGDETAEPFYGEIKDQSGTVRIEAGRNATTEEIQGMDYLVSNVVGEIPAF